jgi:hypothetical protein
MHFHFSAFFFFVQMISSIYHRLGNVNRAVTHVSIVFR